MEKFEEHDGIGIGMAISAMSVVFFGLLLLFISFKLIGKASVSLSKRNAMKVKGITDKKEAKEKKLGEAPGEVFALLPWQCTKCKAMYTMWKKLFLPSPVSNAVIHHGVLRFTPCAKLPTKSKSPNKKIKR